MTGGAVKKLWCAFVLVLALLGLQVGAATAASPPAPPPEVIATAAVPIIAPDVSKRFHSKAGKKLRAEVGDRCAKAWLAKYSYWSSDALLCGGIAIGMPGWGVACAVGMWVGGEFIPYENACD